MAMPSLCISVMAAITRRRACCIFSAAACAQWLECFFSLRWLAAPISFSFTRRQVQLGENLFHAINLVAEIVGIHLPAFLMGDRATLLKIFQCRHNHWRVLRCGHELVARSIVFGKASILSVGTLRCFRVMKAIAPRQRKPAQ